MITGFDSAEHFPSADGETEPTFRVRSLTKIYRTGPTEVHALQGLDLDLFPGEFVVLLGPSGSGKSTLLNILGGLDTPNLGHGALSNSDLLEAGRCLVDKYRREHVGFVFQFYNLFQA